MRTIAQKNNRKRADAIRVLLNAAAHLRERGSFESTAIKTLLECSVKVLAVNIYMAYGLRIDRDSIGILGLFPESYYFSLSSGQLIRLHSLERISHAEN